MFRFFSHDFYSFIRITRKTQATKEWHMYWKSDGNNPSLFPLFKKIISMWNKLYSVFCVIRCAIEEFPPLVNTSTCARTLIPGFGFLAVVRRSRNSMMQTIYCNMEKRWGRKNNSTYIAMGQKKKIIKKPTDNNTQIMHMICKCSASPYRFDILLPRCLFVQIKNKQERARQTSRDRDTLWDLVGSIRCRFFADFISWYGF